MSKGNEVIGQVTRSLARVVMWLMIRVAVSEEAGEMVGRMIPYGYLFSIKYL